MITMHCLEICLVTMSNSTRRLKCFKMQINTASFFLQINIDGFYSIFIFRANGRQRYTIFDEQTKSGLRMYIKRVLNSLEWYQKNQLSTELVMGESDFCTHSFFKMKILIILLFLLVVAPNYSMTCNIQEGLYLVDFRTLADNCPEDFYSIRKTFCKHQCKYQVLNRKSNILSFQELSDIIYQKDWSNGWLWKYCLNIDIIKL